MPRLTSLWLQVMPFLFVFLWSTGFIGARFGLPYAEPLTFLFIRFVLTLLVLSVLLRVVGASLPADFRLRVHIAVAGVLVHGVYLGSVFSAIYRGMPAGVVALIVGLQPLLMAILARPWLGERISGRQWLGIMLGLVGVVLVLGEQLEPGSMGRMFTDFGLDAVLLALLALVGISVGTLYQKRYCTGMDLLSGTLIQYVGAALVLGAAAVVLETHTIDWTPTFVLTLLWLVFGLSIAAIMLLMTLIRRGAASSVASLFYLVPPVTAVEAWLLFGERLGLMALVGIGVAVLGVALAVQQQR
ncbi:MAG: DMT family transporter [Aquisalimonadaceae bacterium]